MCIKSNLENIKEVLTRLNSNLVKTFIGSIQTSSLPSTPDGTTHDITIKQLPSSYTKLLAWIPIGYMPSATYNTVIYFRHPTLEANSINLPVFVKGTTSQQYSIQYLILYR